MSAAAREAIFWIAVLCTAVAEVFIVRAVLRARDAARPAGAAVPPTRRGVEILWAAIPALLLVLVLALTWRAMRAGHEPPPAAARAALYAPGAGDPA